MAFEKYGVVREDEETPVEEPAEEEAEDTEE